MYKRIVLSLFIFAFVIACSPSPDSQPPDDAAATQISQQVATEVSRRLTALPSTTPAPTQVPPTVAHTNTPAPTETLTSTPTPISTPTPSPYPDDLRSTLGPPTWQDTFTNAANWYLYEDDHSKIELEDGNLRLTARNADGWSSWALTWPVVSDFYLEASMIPDDCTGLDRYGLVFRAPSGNEAYLFGFSCDGNYSLRKWDGELFTMVQIWAPSQIINAGPQQTNRIGVLAQGDRLAMYANGQFLSEVQDDSYDKGAFGLFIGSVNTRNFRVEVSEIAYWDLSADR